jgi:hypothetical protein
MTSNGTTWEKVQPSEVAIIEEEVASLAAAIVVALRSARAAS